MLRKLKIRYDKKFYCGEVDDWRKKRKKLFACRKSVGGKTSCSLKDFCYNEIIERQRTIMEEKTKADVVFKEFWRQNERFADLFNTVIFNGKEVIRPENLSEMDTDVSGTIEMKNYKETLTRARDVVKKTAYGVEFVVMGVENQEKVHYAMPLRTMIYDSLGYLKEYKEITSSRKKDKSLETQAEFLSKMKKEDRLHPIISLTIYYGENVWDGPYCLKDMVVEMPPEIEAVFSDYKMNLLEVRDSGKYLFNNRDVEVVFDITRKTFAGNIEEIRQKYEHEKLSSEMLSVIGKMTGSKEIMEMGNNKEVDSMCTALEKLKQQGIDQGKKEGIEQGKKEGIEQGKKEGIEEGKLTIIKNLLVSGMSQEKIKTAAGVTEEEIKQAQREL